MSRNKEVLEAFESFRQKHSKQNREIIVNNTLLNIRNQQLQQDLARLWDENTQLRLQLAQQNHHRNTTQNETIDSVIDQLLSLKSDSQQTGTSQPVSLNASDRRVLAVPPELDSIHEVYGRGDDDGEGVEEEEIPEDDQAEDQNGVIDISSSSSENDEPSEEAIKSRLKSRRRTRNRASLDFRKGGSKRRLADDEDEEDDNDNEVDTKQPSTRRKTRLSASGGTSNSAYKPSRSNGSASASQTTPNKRRRTQRRSSISASVEPATESMKLRIQRGSKGRSEDEDDDEKENENDDVDDNNSDNDGSQYEFRTEDRPDTSGRDIITVTAMKKGKKSQPASSDNSASRSPSGERTRQRDSRTGTPDTPEPGIARSARARKSVNYALPNLKQKMRSET